MVDKMLALQVFLTMFNVECPSKWFLQAMTFNENEDRTQIQMKYVCCKFWIPTDQ